MLMRRQDWLAKMTTGKKEIWPHLEDTYGKKDTAMWFYRWQIFYMACAELFAYEGGDTWGIAHYLFEKPWSGKIQKFLFVDNSLYYQ
jgi:cation-transporting P-type ATPase 13A2